MGPAFISYSTSDRQLAARLVEQLEGADIPCWIAPRDIPVGDNYDDVLNDAVASAGCVVFLLSAASVKSEYCSTELAMAREDGKTIIPIRLDKTKAVGRFRTYLITRQWLDASDGDPFPLPELIATLRRVAGSSFEPVPEPELVPSSEERAPSGPTVVEPPPTSEPNPVRPDRVPRLTAGASYQTLLDDASEAARELDRRLGVWAAKHGCAYVIGASSCSLDAGGAVIGRLYPQRDNFSLRLKSLTDAGLSEDAHRISAMVMSIQTEVTTLPASSLTCAAVLKHWDFVDGQLLRSFADALGSV